MLITRGALKASAVASREDPRYSLNGILIEPDGSAVATDGHRLVKFTPPSSIAKSGDEFPTVEGCNAATNGELEPFILPTETCKAILKAIPKKPTVPILAYVALDVEQTNGDGQAVLAVTDLESRQVFRPEKIEGNFPRYQNVIPDKSTAVARVSFNPRYMADLCKLVADMAGKWGGAYTTGAVTLTLYGKPEENAPIRLDCKGPDGEAIAVLMPMAD